MGHNKRGQLTYLCVNLEMLMQVRKSTNLNECARLNRRNQLFEVGPGWSVFIFSRNSRGTKSGIQGSSVSSHNERSETRKFHNLGSFLHVCSGKHWCMVSMSLCARILYVESIMAVSVSCAYASMTTTNRVKQKCCKVVQAIVWMQRVFVWAGDINLSDGQHSCCGT
jgi:hypothetical protein